MIKVKPFSFLLKKCYKVFIHSKYACFLKDHNASYSKESLYSTSLLSNPIASAININYVYSLLEGRALNSIYVFTECSSSFFLDTFKFYSVLKYLFYNRRYLYNISGFANFPGFVDILRINMVVYLDNFFPWNNPSIYASYTVLELFKLTMRSSQLWWLNLTLSLNKKFSEEFFKPPVVHYKMSSLTSWHFGLIGRSLDFKWCKWSRIYPFKGRPLLYEPYGLNGAVYSLSRETFTTTWGVNSVEVSINNAPLI